MNDNERPAERDDYCGNCPECGRTNGCLSVGPDQWCYCREHKTRWSIGSGHFSSWEHLSEEDWARNDAILSECRDVAPVFPLPEDPWEALGYIESRLRQEVWGKKYGLLEAIELAVAALAVEEPTWEQFRVARFLDTVLGQLSARQRPPITPPKRESEAEVDTDYEIPF